ncbi:unnamed protein product [Fraxinus pennsylvanica]|uniref:Uncharacterized protein n=1 Tax=Fraxinus pennsylvanica TaxID=56036 RepID=A0AAD1ZAC4_9LAMI|nr:unnamed protein product [Fraxinus pennsylvanica]
MPGIAERNYSYRDNNITNYQNPSVGNGTMSFHASNGSLISSGNGNGFWSKHRDDISYNQLQKFWSELTPLARQELLRIDKQTLFEQARKNMYCSRCNGLLLEGFLQIVMYGKSLLQQEETGGHYSVRTTKHQNDGDLGMTNRSQDDVQDPSVYPWGGLTTTRDGTLTLLDCYLYSKSLKGLQNVFDSARARERERELLYPDACGGGGRGWLSQGMAGYSRGHGTRETCALHTARLSVDTLVDFWSALGEETHQSLLRMKEEDFMERLMYRFDSKRFCRDCRRNVIREFKELKELKRVRRQPRCSSWFCVADTTFQYEVSHDTVQADWDQTFLDTFGTYHHFEWAVGSGEGKSDILEFENVGLSKRVQVNGLDLSGLNACYITLRAWKIDGRCTELSAKAHALRGQQCVHSRLVVGDGFVTITRGESIKRFFEHAEEAEEEEDDDSVDKDGNELDGECSRPQKHAKSPELAREFLLDAATIIFKEQAQKAFREGTARQNAHSTFVCLAIKLLNDRVHVACKEIITLEKQMKLLEEEEKEKREEEERKERRRTKEREKKLRRKERLREKENREKKIAELNQDSVVSDVTKEESSLNLDIDENVTSNRNSLGEIGEAVPSSPLSPDIQDNQLLDQYIYSDMQNYNEDSPDGEYVDVKDWNSSIPYDHFKYSRRKPKFWKDFQHDLNLKWSDRRKAAVLLESGGMISKYESRYQGDNFKSSRSINGFSKQLRNNAAKSNTRNSGSKFSEKFQCTNNRVSDRYDSHACSCNYHYDYRARAERAGSEPKYVNKSESASDISKPYYRGNKYNQIVCTREINERTKSKIIAGNIASNTRKVWEPMDSNKKYIRSNSDTDVTLRSNLKVEASESDQLPGSSGATSSDELTDISVQVNLEDNHVQKLTKPSIETIRNGQNGLHEMEESPQYSEKVADEHGKLCPMTRSLHGTLDSSMSSCSNSDNCSFCLNEGDSNSSSNPQNLELSSNSDSEDTSQNSEGRETSHCLENRFTECRGVVLESLQSTDRGEDVRNWTHCAGTNSVENLPTKAAPECDIGRANISVGDQPQSLLPSFQNQSMHFPMFQAATMGYYQQRPVSWSASSANGLMPFPHPSHYLFASPLGYGLNGNTQYMQYGPLQHLCPPVLNPAHLPVFHPVAQVSGICSNELPKISNLGGLKSQNKSDLQKATPTVQDQIEAPTAVETEQHGKSDKPDMENTGFSLFHYGGPVALSTGFQSDPACLKEGITGDISPNLSADNPESDHACNKKDSIEEYNLFAASNGIKFSFL